MSRPQADPSAAQDAMAAAEAAARSQGLHIRAITDLADQQDAAALLSTIWHNDPTSPMISAELLRSFSHAGNYVAGAFLDGELVGTLVGFFGEPAEGVLHSHIAGVAPRARGRSIGFAMKVHQRAWALEHGITAITWTFDPLVRRNAYFNISKLGALPVEYLTDFYGAMPDQVNAGGQTDRFLAYWQLTSARARQAADGMATTPSPLLTARGTVLLDSDSAGGPVLCDYTPGGPLLIATPEDIEALRRDDLPLATQWRLRSRAAFGVALANGYRVIGVSRTGWYVLTLEALTEGAG